MFVQVGKYRSSFIKVKDESGQARDTTRRTQELIDGAFKEIRSQPFSPFSVISGIPGDSDICVTPGTVFWYDQDNAEIAEIAVMEMASDDDPDNRVHSVSSGDIIYIEVSHNSTTRNPESAKIEVSDSDGWAGYPEPVTFSGGKQNFTFIPLAVIKHNSDVTSDIDCPSGITGGGLWIYQLQSSNIRLVASSYGYEWAWMPIHDNGTIPSA